MLTTIDRAELVSALATDSLTLVEALPEAHFRSEHLPGAVNLPGELTAELAATIAPDRSRTVVVYCSGPACGRSRVAAAAFTRLGYRDVRVYAGGKAEWFGAGLPMEHVATAG